MMDVQTKELATQVGQAEADRLEVLDRLFTRLNKNSLVERISSRIIGVVSTEIQRLTSEAISLLKEEATWLVQEISTRMVQEIFAIRDAQG